MYIILPVSRNDGLHHKKDLILLIKILDFLLNYLCLKTRVDLFGFKSQHVLRVFLLHRTLINITFSEVLTRYLSSSYPGAVWFMK